MLTTASLLLPHPVCLTPESVPLSRGEHKSVNILKRSYCDELQKALISDHFVLKKQKLWMNPTSLLHGSQLREPQLYFLYLTVYMPESQSGCDHLESIRAGFTHLCIFNRVPAYSRYLITTGYINEWLWISKYLNESHQIYPINLRLMLPSLRHGHSKTSCLITGMTVR